MKICDKCEEEIEGEGVPFELGTGYLCDECANSLAEMLPVFLELFEEAKKKYEQQ